MKHLLSIVLSLVVTTEALAVQYLKQSTAATVPFGPFVDNTDGFTAEVSLTLSQADIRVSKNGGAFAQSNNAAGATHMENGVYGVPLDTTDTGTLGRLRVEMHEAGALPVWQDFMVVPANTYAMVDGTDELNVNTKTINDVSTSSVTTVSSHLGTTGASTPQTADSNTLLVAISARLPAALTAGGNIKSDPLAINGVATTSVTTVGANIGTTQPINFTGTGATAYAKVDVVDWAGAAASAFPANFGNLSITATTGLVSLSPASLTSIQTNDPSMLWSGTINAVTSQTEFSPTTVDFSDPELAPNVLTGQLIAFYHASFPDGPPSVRRILAVDADSSDGTVTIDSAPDFTISNTTKYRIYPVGNQLDSIKTQTDHLGTALELDGAVYRFTTNSLEQAPTGSTTAQIIRDAMKLDATAGAPAAGSIDQKLNKINTDVNTR
jgi:hypothetical protein